MYNSCFNWKGKIFNDFWDCRWNRRWVYLIWGYINYFYNIWLSIVMFYWKRVWEFLVKDNKSRVVDKMISIIDKIINYKIYNWIIGMLSIWIKFNIKIRIMKYGVGYID